MNFPGRLVQGTVPDPVIETLTAFEASFGVCIRLIIPPAEPGAASEVLYATPGIDELPEKGYRGTLLVSETGGTVELEVQLACSSDRDGQEIVSVLTRVLSLLYETSREIRFFTYELSERFEEINLLYSISETLGSTLDLDSGAWKILREVRDVMGAKRGSLWVHGADDGRLHLVAEVGEDGRSGPLSPNDPDAITSMVFREGRSIIATRAPTADQRESGRQGDSFLSVPIRYTPGSGESRTVGVVNLIGRQDEARFNAANQKLLAAIASQVGAAIENNRLVQESLSQERMAREMELAHDLQMKLLPDAERFVAARAAGRVQPTDQVGGDFYQLFELADGRVGVMLGDVSQHGFPSALIMTLAMSAAGIYARESDSPAEVLRGLDEALREELETTEMFLTIFYGVVDPKAGELVYSNAGHPHAFVIRGGSGSFERLFATDPPVGFSGAESFGEQRTAWKRDEDLLLLFTDGLPDALGSPNRRNGEELVLDSAVRHRLKAPSEIVDALFALSSRGEPGPGDDRTALVVKV